MSAVSLVADVYGYNSERLRVSMGRRQDAKLSRAKATAALLMRKVYGYPYVEIAVALGWKDQSSAADACYRASGWAFKDHGYRLMFDALERALRTSGKSEVSDSTTAPLPF